MTTTLNATTSNGLVVTPDNSGNILLQYNGQSAPAFSAYGNSDVSVPNATYTKVTYSQKEYDTNTNYSTSNYRFTPTVAGYYMIHAFFEWNGYGSNGLWSLNIYKNNALWRRFQSGPAVSGNWKSEGTDIMYLNGSTDYVEIFAYQATGSTQTIYNSNGQNFNAFQACLLRGA